MLLVDDFSSKKWVCFLERKKSLSNFKVWISQVENQSQCKLSFLRVDNGGEFISFEESLASKGIQCETIIHYTPQ